MQTIYQQYLDTAKKKAMGLANNAISNVTLPQGNPAGQGAANTSAANVTPQGAIQNGVNAATSQFAAGTNTGAVATNNGASGSPQSAMQGKVNSALNQFYASAPGKTAPTSTLGGRTADGKYRLADGSTYDTLQGAINANAGANAYVISEENGETLYDGKPLHNGTGVLAAKGDGGKITSGPMFGTRVRDAEGNIIRPMELGEDAPRGGRSLHGLLKTSNGYIYDFDKATDDELVRMGYIRYPDGSVEVASDADLGNYWLRQGDTEAAKSYLTRVAQDQLKSGTLNVPGTGPVDVSPYYPQSGGKQGGSGGSKPSGQSGQSGQQPVPSGSRTDNPYYIKSPQTPPAYYNTRDPGTTGPAPSGSRPQTQPQKTPEQAYLDQYDYGQAPEWTGTDYETRRDAALAAAQGMRWDGSEYDTQRDEALRRAQSMQWNGSEYQDQRDRLLADAMRPYEGSPYDEKRNAAIEAAAEKWQGSEYQPKRDEALRRAENMQWNYDPNADPVWQALQKQYRREGDRATREALGQAAAMTGGVPSSYAVTAASQAGDYYAAQLSDRLPQVYQDAYNRYLQEFQRQMGISDQYAGFDDREYARWADQQGRDLDLADRYNQYGQQDYGMYQDRVNQQMAGADRYSDYDRTAYQQFLDQYGRELDAADRNNQYGQQAYQQYLDQYGRQLDAADRLNNYGATEYGRYQDRLGQFNTDRNFRYNLNRDAVEDARYEDERDYNRAWNEDERAYSRDYQARRDAVLDSRADREWAQQLKEYADAQNWKATEWQQYLREYEDQLSDKEREWVYQMSRDAEDDRRYWTDYEYQKTRDEENDKRYWDESDYKKHRDEITDQQYYDERDYEHQQDELDWKYKQDEFNYKKEQDEKSWDYTEQQDAYKKYLDAYDMGQQETESGNQDYLEAIAFLDTYGIVEGRYADILGVPPGTTRDDYWARYGYDPSAQSDSGGYSGGGYSGGGGNPPPQTEPPAAPETDPESNSNLFEFSNERHPNGNKMTKGFRSTLASLKAAKAGGTSDAEIRNRIRQLIEDHEITNYEGTLILYELGYQSGSNQQSHGIHNLTMEPFGE